MKRLLLTEEVREIVKKPLGSLIAKPSEESMAALKDIIKKEKPVKVYAVGDFVTSNMIEHNIKTDLVVIDNKIMRKQVENTSITGLRTIKSHNPAGTITSEAWEAIEKSVKDPSIACIKIEGEEDLLTLPVIKFAPIGAIVVYGQPKEGLVIVRVTEKKRKEVDDIISKMEESN